MGPTREMEAAQDDLAEWGVANASRFAPIPCPAPDERKPTPRVVTPHEAAGIAHPNLVDAFATLPQPGLLVEARALQARMLGAEYSTRDFAVVSAMVQRLGAA